MTRDSRSTLLASLHAFVGDERRLVAKCIAYLIEVERRRLDLEMACTSMTDFCQRKLGLSGGQTHRRLTAARLVRRFPQLLSAIAEGRIHLSNLEILAPLFTSDVEADALIANAAGKSKAETQALFAQRRPRPDVPESMTKVEEQVPLGGSPVAAPPAATQPRCLGRPEPLSEERYRLTLTVSAEVHGQIERARALSRHTNLRGDLEPILAQAMALLVAKLERDKLGKTKRPRKSRGTADPADATAATKREVYERDDEQCAYVSMEGERCPARELLEIDHAHPRALGGEGDAANLRVLCRAHNRREAEKIFGSDFIERIHLRQRRSGPHPQPSSISIQTGPPPPTRPNLRRHARADPSSSRPRRRRASACAPPSFLWASGQRTPTKPSPPSRPRRGRGRSRPSCATRSVGSPRRRSTPRAASRSVSSNAEHPRSALSPRPTGPPAHGGARSLRDYASARRSWLKS